jgi:hypothetical protein
MNRRFLKTVLTAALAVLASRTATAADAGFALKDTPGQHLDITLDGKTVAQWVYKFDRTSQETYYGSFKPFLHVYNGQGTEPITQGTDGKQFPHHRGIYVGWNKITPPDGGKTVDRWHANDKGATIHEKFVEQKAAGDSATITSQIKWEGRKPEDPAVLTEERTMSFHRGTAPARLVIDLTTKLTATNGDIELNGDPEHAGIQYRPSPDVVAAESVYVFPKENANPADKNETDYPWVGLTYSLKGQRHSVVNLAHPENPKGTRWSAYRDYGRFGAFPVVKIKKGESVTIRHRFLIADGEMPTAEYIQQQWDTYTGAKSATPTPKITVKPSSAKGTPKPAAKPAATAK